MAEFNDYQSQQIQRIVSNVSSQISKLERAISYTNFNFDIDSAYNSISRYTQTSASAKKQADEIFKTAIKGSGFFFHRAGFNELVNNKAREIEQKTWNIIDEYDKAVNELLVDLEKLDGIVSSTDIFEEEKYAGDSIFDVFFNVQATTQSKNSDADAKTEVPLSKVVEESNTEVFVDSLTAVLENKEIIQKETTPTVAPIEEQQTSKSQTKKRVVISKNTHLDNDEIKTLFLSRHVDCNLTLEQLNKAIDVVGNDVDKDAILLEAMVIRVKECIETFNYFYCYTTLRKAIDIALKLGNAEKALELLCALFFVESSGYIMALPNNRERRSIEETQIDPRITSKIILQLQEMQSLSEEELILAYKQTELVQILFASMPMPLFDVENSAKIMALSFRQPYEFLPCKNLGLPYHK